MRAQHRSPSGFTLLELMIVVVIIGVLATVAVQSYKRFNNRARVQEAIALLGDIKIKQESYYQTYHRYVSASEGANDWWPKEIDWSAMTTTWGMDCTQPGDAASHPGWCALGGGYRSNEQARFQLQVVARDPANPQVPPPQYVKDPSRDWWYVRARSDFTADGKFSDIWLSSEMREPAMDNELE